MRIALALFLVLTSMSCGRRNDNDCRSREHIRLQCQAEHTPSYGRYHAVDICNRSYEVDRCY
jgi:hypothetical protein